MIGTGSEERIGELLAGIAARDPARGIAALDAALAGGADPGGVLEQLLAGLRDCLLASVGCRENLLANSSGLGVDVAALGRELGTATILAMLQILDQALGRMRTSGHAAVIAEMAVVRLASIEDFESLAAAIYRVAAAPVQSVPGLREKKTTDLTPAKAAQPANGQVSPPAAASVAPVAAVAAVAAVAVSVAPVATPPASPPPRARSQVALIRAATDHPLVTHARTLFDAVVRKVEPPRTREPERDGVLTAGLVTDAAPDDGPAEAEPEVPDG